MGDNSKAALVDSLNGLLADLFTLYIKTKNFHWHISGPHFHDLHLLFDQQGTEIFALTDIVAERVRKNGAPTLTSVGAIAAKSRITGQDNAELDAFAMVRELKADNRALVLAIREAKAAATQAGDNATEGMADDWTDQAERRVWFLDQVSK